MKRITITNAATGKSTTVDASRPLTPEKIRKIRRRLAAGDQPGDLLGGHGRQADAAAYAEFLRRAKLAAAGYAAEPSEIDRDMPMSSQLRQAAAAAIAGGARQIDVIDGVFTQPSFFKFYRKNGGIAAATGARLAANCGYTLEAVSDWRKPRRRPVADLPGAGEISVDDFQRLIGRLGFRLELTCTAILGKANQ